MALANRMAISCVLLGMPISAAWAQPVGGERDVIPARLTDVRWINDRSLGAVQGVSIHDGKLYIYGDDYRANPRVGVIAEYTMAGTATGRRIRLMQNGKQLITHPTGLTWDDRWGCCIGDTVGGEGRIHRIDWTKALADGVLDDAVRDVIADDIAINGTRPEFVRVGGATLLATADYGDIARIRLYDPARLIESKRSSAPGVAVYTILCGPFNQNLTWCAASGRLTCVQNATAGKGWRLESFDLEAAIDDGRAWAAKANHRVLQFEETSELEGFRMIDDDHVVFVAAAAGENIIFARITEDMHP